MYFFLKKTPVHVLSLNSPLQEAMGMFLRHNGPGQRRLQVRTQDVEAQHGADGHPTEHQPPLERHPRQGAREPGRHGVCAGPALRSA